MKLKALFVLAIVAIAFGCSKEEAAVVPDNNEKVEINEGTKAGIHDFISKVTGMETRLGPPPPPTRPPTEPPQYKLRKYNESIKDCINGIGSCLPDVIVTPIYPGEPTLRPSLNNTPEGRMLSSMVDNNQISMRKEVNQATNTEFYIYNGVEDKSLEIVIPVAYK